MTYALYHRHTGIGSILDGYGTPEEGAKQATKIGISTLGISDHGSVAGHLRHIDACKKNKLKYVLGNELYISHFPAFIKKPECRLLSHMVVWAKNKEGWKNLLALTNQTNHPDYFYYKPRIHLFNTTEEVDGVVSDRPGLEYFVKKGGIQGFSGHQGTLLANSLFAPVDGMDIPAINAALDLAYKKHKDDGGNPEFYRKFLREGWLEATSKLALQIEGIFGKGNFWIELQNEFNKNDELALTIHPLIVECLRLVGKATGVPTMASGDPHYVKKEDAVDQRTVVMCKMKETESSVKDKIDSGEDTFVFFGSDGFYMKSFDEMKEKFTPEELNATIKAAEGIELYDISSQPILPVFEFKDKIDPKVSKFFPNAATNSMKALAHLCIQGAKKLKPWENPIWKGMIDIKSKDDYWQRLQMEMDVIFEAKLADYFLIVEDICTAARLRPKDHSFDWFANKQKNGEIDPIPTGVGRGSAAGCLVSYLTGITQVDPLIYGLSFGRFYNKGRNTGTHIEYPDIDMDFAVEDRDWIIGYIKWRYGDERVAQIITFQRMQGRAAIKDLFRVKGIENHVFISNEICKHIPPESIIADEIQQMVDAGHDEYGIISWALEHKPELKKYTDDPKYKEIFDQALRLEGTIRGQGRHPSGIIITANRVEDSFPMTYDTRSKQRVVGVDMKEMAKMGGVKFDVLGVAILDKLQYCQDLINGKTKKKLTIKHEEQELE